MSGIDIFLARVVHEEGVRTDPYDDATGLTVRAPVGKLSWGYGFNLTAIGDNELFDVIERFLVGKIEAQLLSFPWYYQINDARQSVLLDIAYNAGVHGLLGYPNMLAALKAGDWAEAAAQCTTTNGALAQRYANLAYILLTGVAS